MNHKGKFLTSVVSGAVIGVVCGQSVRILLPVLHRNARSVRAMKLLSELHKLLKQHPDRNTREMTQVILAVYAGLDSDSLSKEAVDALAQQVIGLRWIASHSRFMGESLYI